MKHCIVFSICLTKIQMLGNCHTQAFFAKYKALALRIVGHWAIYSTYSMLCANPHKRRLPR